VEEADKFITRYLLDTLDRLKEFQRSRPRPRRGGPPRRREELELGGPFDGVVTSPPYPGLIDYHEQHRYAYELLGLDDRRERELGAAARGTSRRALADYVEGISAVLRRCAGALATHGAPVIVVVNDRRGLYPEVLEHSGLVLVDRLERHVNRRTGRRAGEYFESVFVAVRDT
jgi:DNA modification methylase